MNNATIENKMDEKNEGQIRKQKPKIIPSLCGLALTVYLSLLGMKALTPKPEPVNMKQIYQLTRVNRDGSHVYKDEYQVQKGSEEKVVKFYFDSDNNGAPESGYVVFPDGSIRLDKFSNQRTIEGMLKPTSSEYYEASQK